MPTANTIAFSYGDEISASAGMSQVELTETARLAFAAKLFQDGKITLGQAAKLCDQGRVQFMDTLAAHGYSLVNLRDEDVSDDLHFLHA